MQFTNEPPPLSKPPFLAACLALNLAATVIAMRSAAPLGSGPLLAIVVCVALAAVVFLVPFLTDYSRQQDAALAERQRALEALARTTADSAEQISIAAAGLHTITELAQKNFKAAEHLPQKLQEKINAFNERLAETNASELETLQQEIKTLRAAEAEKLESAADKIAHATADLAKLETALRKPRLAAPKPGEGGAAKPSPAAEAAAETELPVSPEATAKEAPPAAPLAAPKLDERGPPAAVATEAAPIVEAAAAEAAAAALAKEILAEEPVAMAAPKAGDGGPAAPAETSAKEPAPKRKRSKPAEAADSSAKVAPAPAAAPEPAPFLDDLGGSTAPMFDLGINDDTPLSPAASFVNESFPTPPPFAFTRKPPPPTAPKPDLPPPSDATAGEAGPAAAEGESAFSSDGQTRIIATAYIGIGNKLFVRGDGPGLSWDKGVPLSFVSIGKWRWETPDATATVTVKLYKNDQQECTVLGPVTLRPGRQHEVTADF